VARAAGLGIRFEDAADAIYKILEDDDNLEIATLSFEGEHIDLMAWVFNFRAGFELANPNCERAIVRVLADFLKRL
jgi:hypothetical protein